MRKNKTCFSYSFILLKTVYEYMFCFLLLLVLDTDTGVDAAYSPSNGKNAY